jgi:hypothetical protein
MKKTSLMLAVGALLYGTSATYVLADCALHEDMTPDEVATFLATLPAASLDLVDPEGLTEGGPLPDDMTLPAGREPFAKLPKNVYVNSNDPIFGKTLRMCKPSSFEVNSGKMAKFPVTVTTNSGTDVVDWMSADSVLPLTGYASGDGWLLVQEKDTWYLDNPWQLYTCDGTKVEQIVLEPMEDLDLNKRVYAFDVGGLTRGKDDPEHTTGAARGRALTIQVPPSAKFTATYSSPVYPGPDPDLHLNGAGDGTDSTDVGPGEYPTHDLYGKLTIDFSTPVASATLAFRFVADTDCLPVREAKIDSYDASSGIVNLTLLGSGLSYVQESCPGGQPSAIPGATFDVQGRAEVSAVVMPTSGCCYSLVDVDTGQNVRLLGVGGPGNSADEVCMP